MKSRIDQKSKQLNQLKMKSLHQIKQNPFPELQLYNRVDIFEIIYLLEEENNRLKKEFTSKLPTRNISQLKQQHQLHQLTETLASIHHQTLSDLQAELKHSLSRHSSVVQENMILQKQHQAVRHQIQSLQKQLVSIQKEKRLMQRQQKHDKDNQEDGDLSAILNQLYLDVKLTINQF